MRCRKEGILVVLVLMTLFLSSCTFGKKTEVNQTNAGLNQSLWLNQSEEANQTLRSQESLAGWKCLGKWEKAYRYQNGSWSGRIECPLGCENGECRKGKTCASGFKCIDESKRGYQTEACLWIKTSVCEGSCEKGECKLIIPKNETNNNRTNTTLVKETPKTETKPKENLETLELNEEKIIGANGATYILRIYLLEPERVKLMVDGTKSDWLKEGGNFTYGSFTISLKEILFQSFAGGKRMISYITK